jgi:hypothetical protein
MLRKDLPLGTKTIMAIWSFKRKQFSDGTLNKHKARLCAHGGQQTWGQDYLGTYALVVTWASIRLLLIAAKIHGLKSKSIVFVLAFPQTDLDMPVYTELPAGVNPTNVSDGDRRRYDLKLNKSLYGIKQAGNNWFKNSAKGSSIVTSFKAMLTNASSFGKIALSLRKLMIASSLDRILQLLMQSFHC